jgi:Rad3-related DNA helicase
MPTGTGKTITLLSLITSYQLAHPEVMDPGQMQLIGLRSCSQ